jgi:hypothetical protein
MTDQALQTLRNMGNEAEAAAEEIDRLQARCAALEEALRECLLLSAALAERQRIALNLDAVQPDIEAIIDRSEAILAP